MTIDPRPADTARHAAVVTGRVALLIAAFACAVAASLASGAVALALIVAAMAMACVAFVRSLALRLGRALKPAARDSAGGIR